MIFAVVRTMAWIGMLCGVCLFCSARVRAQAPPGPMSPSHPLPPPPKAPAAKKKPVVESRSTLAGYWKLNKDESDDPKSKIEDSRHRNDDPSRGPGGNPRVGVGYPQPGGGGPNGPYGGRGTGEEGDNRSAQLEEFVHPAFSQTIDLKNNEVDATNDQDAKLVMFTDNRKPPKQKDNGPEQIPAHWDGPKLVTDEKGPQGRKASRTYELSFDGKQIYETWRIEAKKSGPDIIIRYVYDAAIDEHK
jgi:hypothetical protein